MTTIFVVLVTTFVLGGSTEWALKGLGIPLDVDESKHLKSLPPRQLLPGMLRRFENYHLRSWVIRNFERRLREEGTVADDPSEAADYYEEHVEMTEQQHLHNVDKKSSVYDFGH